MEHFLDVATPFHPANLLSFGGLYTPDDIWSSDNSSWLIAALKKHPKPPKYPSQPAAWCTLPEGWGPISDQYFDLTPCFLDLTLLIISAVTILLSVVQLAKLHSNKVTVANRFHWSLPLKLALIVGQLVLLALHFQAMGNWIHTFGDAPLVGSIKLAAFSANVAATALSLYHHYVDFYKQNVPLGVLLFFWLLQLLLGSFQAIGMHLRSDLGDKSSYNPAFSLTILFSINAFLILLLDAAFPPKPVVASRRKQSPYDSANIFSRITFEWMAPLMRKGYLHYLTEEDLPPLPAELKAKTTYSQFQKQWDIQKSKSSLNPLLSMALSRAFGFPFVIGGIFKFIQDCLGFVQPQLLRLLIKFVTEYLELKNAKSLDGTPVEPLPLTKGIMIALGMFVVSVTQTAALHQYFHRAFGMGMVVKLLLTLAVYAKSLVLSNEARGESNTGDIVNLMSVDTQRLQDLSQNLQIVWLGPLQIIICLFSLHGILGNSMWAGVTIMIIMIPFNGMIARYQKKLQKTQMGYKDERSRLISEILNNIKSLKLYGWEDPYLSKLNHVRNDKELDNLRRMGVFSAISVFLWNLAPFLVSCSTFALFVFTLNKLLLTDIVFPALLLFNLLSFPLAVVPMTITNIVEAQVAILRLTKFLTALELQQDAVQKSSTGCGVSVKNGTFLWTKTNGEETYKVALSHINLEVPKGNLDCIVGKVGSGKLSIIQAILGDLYRLEGEVKVSGSVAYVSQVPWIMNGTVRENILFGHRYDPEFYKTVLNACALSVDLKILPKGDKTEVGEKGISLSGGQKARLSLARAVYARADVYLLDDPLSAVDEHVGRHLIDNVLGPKGLLNTKCKVLATNAIKVLSIADSIHLVAEGRLVEQGTYDEIIKKSKSPLKSLIEEFGKEAEKKETVEEEVEIPKVQTPLEGTLSDENSVKDFDGTSGITAAQRNAEIDDVKSLRRASLATLVSDEEEELEENDHQSVANSELRKEHVEQGKVKWSVYLAYAKACNPWAVLWYLSFTLLSTLALVFLNIWLKHWSEVNTEKGKNPHIGLYLGTYFALGLLLSALSLAQNCIMWIFCTIAGLKLLHNRMAISVLRAPMLFFETTPIGRILNRFSNDVYKIDEILGRTFGMFFQNSTRVFFTLIVICFLTWQFIFFLAPIGILYVYYQQFYLKTSREVRRLDSVTRSPIYANFQELLQGVSIIRAYGQLDRFLHLNEARVDRNMSAYHPLINSNRWLAVRLEFLGSLIILGAAGLSILTLPTGRLTAGMVGLSVSYSLQITQSLNWIVRMTVEVETNIVSVERIMEYLSLTPEAPAIIEDSRPPTSWPESGRVEFKNYLTKYRPDLDLVLKNINLNIRPHEKIGIVGRTGAGKSSLTLALFRIIEAVEGNILIDQLNTSTIGLADLRHNLLIIPQDLQVFEGTIRSNLDPTEVNLDDKLWKALELSHLKDTVIRMAEEGDQTLESALDVKISEGGLNLSVGQRQLMCLARALLIPLHILVLDEATAAVDVETDKVLQETIREEFKDRTILTIAHRLNTIIDLDRIIVLDAGEVAEFDTPEELLKRKDSVFYALAKEGGLVKD